MLDNLTLQRLNNHHLIGMPFEDPGEVIAWLGAVQAQEYALAKWALALRMQSATDEAIEQAFTNGDILRTHVMRPTWHFVTPTDIRWILALTAPRVHAVNAYMYRKLECDEVLLRRSDAIIANALRGGQALTRSELAAALEQAGIVADGMRLGYIVHHAELEAVICSGPRRGKQFTYMLMEERVPPTPNLTRDEALAELTRRYFTSHGPAQAKDFVGWSGLTMADARAGLAMLSSELKHEVVNGQTYWFSSSMTLPPDIPLTVHLLPPYDEYTIAYRDHSAFLDAAYGEQVNTNMRTFTAFFTINGRIEGMWKRAVSKGTAVIETVPFRPLTPAEKDAFESAARRYGNFLGMPVVLQ